MREAELASGLEHACIVRLLDAGEHDGAPFLAMELVEAETLRQRLDRERRLELAAAWPIFCALARALDHAHGRGVIHRDVKPENVFVAGWKVKLGDFGNARVVSLASVTGASLTWGTPEYVAPELFMRGRVNPRSDLFALGVVFYEMLTGRLPWSRAEALTRLGVRNASTPTFPPSGASEDIDRVLADLLAFSPADRPASGEEAMTRIAEPGSVALVRTTRCPACGAAIPGDLPRCLGCGQELVRFRHSPDGWWRVVLRTLPDDAGVTGKLLSLLDPLVKPHSEPLQFLTGDRDLDDQEGYSLPAVLFSRLDEPTARALAALLRRGDLDVDVVEGILEDPLAKSRRIPLRRLLVFGIFVGLGLGRWTNSLWVGLVGCVGISGLTWLSARAMKRRGLLKTAAIFELREQIAPAPLADDLLRGAAEAVVGIEAPEVRLLVADLGLELYRLTRRATALETRTGIPSSEADLVRRAAATAPLLMGRLRQIVDHLGTLDRALAGPSEAELMQALGRIERAATGPGADKDAIASARADATHTLERRHAAEEQRARLAAQLCSLLGRLRLVCRRARKVEMSDDQDARALEAASAELDAFLAAGAGKDQRASFRSDEC